VLGKPVYSKFTIVPAADFVAAAPSMSTPPTIATFAGTSFGVQEMFGVPHPDQILPLHITLDPGTQKVLRNAVEVPYQVDGDGILVRMTGGIAGNGFYGWDIEDGARSAVSQVSVTDGGPYYQIDNDLVAVRIPKTITIGTQPSLKTEPDPNH